MPKKDEPGPVEQATAAPGEQRHVGRERRCGAFMGEVDWSRVMNDSGLHPVAISRCSLVKGHNGDHKFDA